jgi:threonylcarbamoyladenosine tRNA methylthiotransferase MtaB
VLTGINLGRFSGCTPSGDAIALPGLLDLIMSETEVERVRLSSIEPPDVTDDLLGSMARHGERIAPFLHVCLQSGCDRTLGRMGRVYDTSLFRSVVRRSREALPDLALGTDLIVGFPGETDADFEESLSFCREMDFAKMHVFRYSRRPGTPAATAEGQVDPRVMAKRSRRMRGLAREMRHAQAAALVGRDDLVIVQYPGRAVTGGLFDVRLDPSIPVDSLVRVRLSSVMADGTLVASAL